MKRFAVSVWHDACIMTKALSPKPDAVRQRRSRRRKRDGLMIYSLPLPKTIVEAAIRQRESVPDNVKLPKKLILRNLAEGTIIWALPFARLYRKRHA
jgi:hypothetical protein